MGGRERKGGKKKKENKKETKEKEEKEHIGGEKMLVEERKNVDEEPKFVQENKNISEGIHASLPVATVMASNEEVYNGRVPVVEEICVQTRIAPKTSIESPALKQKTPNSNSKQKKFSTD